MIRFRCPQCGNGGKVPAELAGRVIKCRECGEPIKIPKRRAAPTPPPSSHDNDVILDEDFANEARSGFRFPKLTIRQMLVYPLFGFLVLMGIFGLLLPDKHETPKQNADMQTDSNEMPIAIEMPTATAEIRIVTQHLAGNKLGITAEDLRTLPNPRGEGTFVYCPTTRFYGVERKVIWIVLNDQAIPLNGATKGSVTPSLPWPREVPEEQWKATGLDPHSATEPIEIVFEGKSPFPSLDVAQTTEQVKDRPQPEDLLGEWGAKHEIERGTIKRIGDVDVVLGYKCSIVYVPKNASNIVESNMPTTFGVFYPVGYRKPSAAPFVDHTAGFIPVNGKAERITYESSDDSIAKVYEDGSVGFRSEGKIKINVKVAGESISVSLNVVELPLNASLVPDKATNVKDVVSTLGFPDRKTKHYISWPESQQIDGIYYSPSVGGGIATEHWEYDAHPGAVIAIVGNSTSGWVWCVSTKSGTFSTADQMQVDNGMKVITLSNPSAPNETPQLNPGTTPGQEWQGNQLGMRFCWCPAGSFQMGFPEDQVSVTLTQGFWLGKYEVTQGEWQRVMSTIPWRGQQDVREGTDYAASCISWNDAVTFCEKLTTQEREAGRLPEGWEFALPTEAQWEYACRAGTTTVYSFGKGETQLADYAWYGGHADAGTAKNEQYAHTVGQKKPNPWGLHDVHGNVWEWCQDAKTTPVSGGRDPIVLDGGSDRVARGGGWPAAAENCGSASRGGTRPTNLDNRSGFRVAIVPSR